jgi:hypothetical protein
MNTPAPYRTEEEAQAYVWNTLTPDVKKAVVGQLDGIHGSGKWGPKEFYNLPAVRGRLEEKYGPVTMEYGEMDPSKSAGNMTPSKFWEVIKDEISAYSSLLTTDPRETITGMYDMARGFTRRGPGFTQIDDLAGGDLERQQGMADAATAEIRGQFSPAGLENDPLRALATGSALLPTGAARAVVKAARGPKLLQKISAAADVASDLASGDPLSLGIQGARLSKTIYNKLGSGGEGRGVVDRLMPSEPKAGRAYGKIRGERPTSTGRDILGTSLSMMGGMPLRTFVEALDIRDKPFIRGGKPVKRKMGDKGRQLMLHDVMQHFSKLGPSERMKRLGLRIHEGADAINEKANKAYKAGMAQLAEKMGKNIDLDTYNGFTDRLSEHFDKSELGIRIEISTADLPDPPPGVPKPNNPIPKIEVIWDKTMLSDFLKGRRGEVTEVLETIVNANREPWGGTKIVTLDDVYIARREVDQLIKSIPITESLTPNARVAFQELRTKMQNELGQLLGPDYPVIMKDYENHIDLLENMAEHLDVVPGQIKKSGGVVRKLEQGVESAVSKKLKTILGSEDGARKAMDQLYLLQEMVGDNDLVPLLIGSTSSQWLANNLVARSAIIGGFGLGGYAMAGGIGDGMALGSMVTGAASGFAGFAGMSPKFINSAIAKTGAMKGWLDHNGKKLGKLSRTNPALLGTITKLAVEQGWNTARTIHSLENAFNEGRVQVTPIARGAQE